MTELKSTLSRELTLGRARYKLTIGPHGFKLVLKGKRKGLEIAWLDLISGDAAMAVALRASLQAPIAAPSQHGTRGAQKSSNRKRMH
jgi:hypothetical protein